MDAIGDISEPVVSDYGVHIVQYAGDAPAGPIELTDDLKAVIYQNLYDDKCNAVLNDWLRFRRYPVHRHYPFRRADSGRGSGSRRYSRITNPIGKERPSGRSFLCSAFDLPMRRSMLAVGAASSFRRNKPSVSGRHCPSGWPANYTVARYIACDSCSPHLFPVLAVNR